MQAQTLQVRRTIRFPWKVLLVVALVAVMFAVGIGVATSGNDTTTVPPRVEYRIGPKDLSGPTAYPGFVPGQRIPHPTLGQGGASGDQHVAASFTAANGKPLT